VKTPAPDSAAWLAEFLSAWNGSTLFVPLSELLKERQRAEEAIAQNRASNDASRIIAGHYEQEKYRAERAENRAIVAEAAAKDLRRQVDQLTQQLAGLASEIPAAERGAPFDEPNCFNPNRPEVRT
jgi:ubiquinone biosynthesis protein UbiJ